MTTDAINKSIDVSDIPLSIDPLVTARRVYLSKDSGTYYLSSQIDDNTTTTLSITSDTTSLITPAEDDYISKINGELFIESSIQLCAISAQEMRRFFPGNLANTSGIPRAYSMLGYNRAIFYPAPSADTVISYYYSKNPRGIHASSDSVPTIPRALKEVLAAGVEWKGYQYRDRSGKLEVFRYYNDLLTTFISRLGSADRQSYTVRDVEGDSDGFAVN